MLAGMVELDAISRRALETGWPFVARQMAGVRDALSECGAAGAGALVPRALYFQLLRTLRALESLVRRMLYLMSLQLEVSCPAPRPAPAPGQAPRPQADARPVAAHRSPRGIPLADTLTLYIPPPEPPVRYGPRPSVWMLGMPRAPEPPGPPDTLDPAPLLARLDRIAASCADPAAEARRMARWQARRRAAMQAGRRGRTHPLRMGRPPGYARQRLRRDALQQKLRDFWYFCHWADTAGHPAQPPPGGPGGSPRAA